MSITVVPVPARLTIDLNNVFTNQDLFNTIYSNLPTDQQYTITGISFPFLGMSCKTEGILAQFMKAITAILSVFGLNFSVPVVTINYTACATPTASIV
jgi:hypothetical protein